jgi:hypothetical protein
MAAPKENQFWKQRSKHGRDKLFASPDLLWQAACEYFDWCDKNPWFKNDVVKGGADVGTTLRIPVARPYTLTGLCIYLKCNSAYFRTFKVQALEADKDFNTVITQIEETIETQQFEGAVVGVFNSNIISRKLGLVEKVENSNINTNFNLSPMTQDEIKEISQALHHEYL